MPQLSLKGTGDVADTFAAAVFEAKRKAHPAGLLQPDVAAVLRPLIADAKAESYTEGFRDGSEKKGKKAGPSNAKVIPPEPEWVTEYSASIGYPLNGQRWCDSYEAKGWVVSGKSQRMKNWRAAVNTWKGGGWGVDSGIYLGPPKQKPVDLRYATEPKGDWRATARKLLGHPALPDHWVTWPDVPPDYRARIAQSHTP